MGDGGPGPAHHLSDAKALERHGHCLLIDSVGLAIDRLHATADEVDRPLRLAVVGTAGVKNNRLIAFYRLDQGLHVMQLARMEHQKLRHVGLCRAVHGHYIAREENKDNVRCTESRTPTIASFFF